MNKIEQELYVEIERNVFGDKMNDEFPTTVFGINEASNHCYSILEKHCIGFAKWRMGTMYDKEKGIDGKKIIRDNPDNYWEILFKLYIEQL